jgi:hypothetical protein
VISFSSLTLWPIFVSSDIPSLDPGLHRKVDIRIPDDPCAAAGSLAEPWLGQGGRCHSPGIDRGPGRGFRPPRAIRRPVTSLTRRYFDRLVLAKLKHEAQAVRGEGWAWVMVTPELDFRRGAICDGFTRPNRQRQEPTQA